MSRPKTTGSFKKGDKRAGRPKGIQNKINKTVKETVLSVFNTLQDDPQNNLTAFAKAYPRDFYNIAAKLIPTELSGKVSEKITLQIVRKAANAEP